MIDIVRFIYYDWHIRIDIVWFIYYDSHIMIHIVWFTAYDSHHMTHIVWLTLYDWHIMIDMLYACLCFHRSSSSDRVPGVVSLCQAEQLPSSIGWGRSGGPTPKDSSQHQPGRRPICPAHHVIEKLRLCCVSRFLWNSHCCTPWNENRYCLADVLFLVINFYLAFFYEVESATKGVVMCHYPRKHPMAL